jgi:hypothetical protein
MRLPLIAGLAVLIGGVTAFADSSSPKEIVQSLQTVKGHYVTYTKPEQVKTVKGVLTPQLFSALLDWSTWLQKAYKAIPANDYDAQMMMPMSDNPFFGESDQTGDPAPVETISGETATVVAKSTVTDADGKSVLRKNTNTFQFVREKGKWLLSDVQQESSAFPDWKPMKSNLLAYLKEQTATYKKKR